MGKSLVQQRRGKGSLTFRAPSFRYLGKVCYRKYTEAEKKDKVAGTVVSIEHSAGHYSPVASISYADEQQALMIAPQGIRVGDPVEAGVTAVIARGNVLPLGHIPDGTLVCNIEASPGDGGKFVRSSGGSAKVLSRFGKEVTVLLPSKKKRFFSLWCRATIGIVAGSGRTEKPLLKAGSGMRKKRARGKYWPHVKGISMNAVAHPFGGSSSSKKNKPSAARRFAPPGAKVGHLRPRRTGRRKMK